MNTDMAQWIEFEVFVRKCLPKTDDLQLALKQLYKVYCKTLPEYRNNENNHGFCASFAAFKAKMLTVKYDSLSEFFLYAQDLKRDMYKNRTQLNIEASTCATITPVNNLPLENAVLNASNVQFSLPTDNLSSTSVASCTLDNIPDADITSVTLINSTLHHSLHTTASHHTTNSLLTGDDAKSLCNTELSLNVSTTCTQNSSVVNNSKYVTCDDIINSCSMSSVLSDSHNNKIGVSSSSLHVHGDCRTNTEQHNDDCSYDTLNPMSSNSIEVENTVNSQSRIYNRRLTSKHEQRLKSLEITMEKLHAEIKRVETNEVSLDEMDCEDSAYIYQDKLEKRFNKIWRVYRKLSGKTWRTGRSVDKPFRYQGCEYQAVNERIESFVKQGKFPDFTDVRKIMEQVNKEQQLKLSPASIDTFARTIFEEVGCSLKKRRLVDFNELFFDYHLKQASAQTNELALLSHNAELRRVLDENRVLAMTKINAVLDHFVDLQESSTSTQHKTSSEVEDDSENDNSKSDDDTITDNDQNDSDDHQMTTEKVDNKTDSVTLHTDTRVHNMQSASTIITSSPVPRILLNDESLTSDKQTGVMVNNDINKSRPVVNDTDKWCVTSDVELDDVIDKGCHRDDNITSRKRAHSPNSSMYDINVNSSKLENICKKLLSSACHTKTLPYNLDSDNEHDVVEEIISDDSPPITIHPKPLSNCANIKTTSSNVNKIEPVVTDSHREHIVQVCIDDDDECIEISGDINHLQRLDNTKNLTKSNQLFNNNLSKEWQSAIKNKDEMLLARNKTAKSTVSHIKIAGFPNPIISKLNSDKDHNQNLITRDKVTTSQTKKPNCDRFKYSNNFNRILHDSDNSYSLPSFPYSNVSGQRLRWEMSTTTASTQKLNNVGAVNCQRYIVPQKLEPNKNVSNLSVARKGSNDVIVIDE